MRTLLSLALVLALFAPADAGHCSTWSTTTPDHTAGVPGATPVYYIDYVWHDGIDQGGWWIYEESNGLPGLQHEDEAVDDTCHGMIRGDTLIF